MPNWTPEELRNYENKNRRVPPSPVAEPAVQNEPLGQDGGEKEDTKRIAVRVVSFRQKLLDPDNPVIKYFVDGLRYSGLIPNDRQEDITVEVGQKKVAHKEDERTEIILDL
jgi:hypothetical protein